MATASAENKPLHNFQASLPRRRSFSDRSRSLKGKHSGRKRLTIELVPESFRKVTGVREEGVEHGGIPVRLVELDLDGKPLGFHVERRLSEDVAGGRHWQVLISELEKGSVVQSQGLLCEGDEVIRINGTCVKDVCSQQEIGLLLQVSDCLSLAIASKTACNSPDNGPPTSPSSSASLDSLGSTPETPSPEMLLYPDARRRSSSASRQFRAVRSKGLSRTASLGHAASDDLIGTGAKRTASPDWPRTPGKVKAEEASWTKSLPLLFPGRRPTTGLSARSHTRMLQLAEIFVPECGDRGEGGISLRERRELFAKCLAEEFDLPFLIDANPEPLAVRL